ncbi:MAG TPA: hypothetical protein VFY66_09215 [Anaerolineales bacterium]|nr:hypothetical protein [Anaerolineales bacterium]
MNQSDRSEENEAPNIHIPENKNVLAYLKEMHPFKEIILPFSADRVNQDITPSDFVGRFASMSSLPENSKYVVYGTEALVHPTTGILFGFITGTSLIYRLPDNILKEVRENSLVNFRALKDSSKMEDLESNWVTSPSITEKLVRKCFEYYGQASPEEEVVHLNYELDLTTPRTREFEAKERRNRLLPLGVIVVICVVGVLLLYAANYVMQLL